MPKKSRAETKLTIESIMQAVEDQLVRLGYDKMSYTTLSAQTGISRTGISHHFPKKKDFIAALDIKIYNMFVAHLVLDKDIEDFSASWLESLSRPEFASLLRILFHHIVSSPDNDDYGREGVDRLYRLLYSKFGSSSAKELEWLIGKSLVLMSKHSVPTRKAA